MTTRDELRVALLDLYQDAADPEGHADRILAYLDKHNLEIPTIVSRPGATAALPWPLADQPVDDVPLPCPHCGQVGRCDADLCDLRTPT